MQWSKMSHQVPWVRSMGWVIEWSWRGRLEQKWSETKLSQVGQEDKWKEEKMSRKDKRSELKITSITNQNEKHNQLQHELNN
jgi:hypothetical protein